ncbi:MAG TPA: HlyD family type I secretion periplasmic adaptor subunit [Burkholderiales bacterium]|jgi:adhesin transport system membrane fusion protein|nr:HlyD family type I secretion periplasmic adaptor subunit [Burkholderiales bacterium]
MSARLPSILVWALVVTVGALVYWAERSVIDESTRAAGTVIASSRVQVIQSVDGGVLQQLRVREGDRVRKGEVLAVFDETRTRASLEETEAKRTAQRASMARLEAELEDGQPHFAPELMKRFPAVVRVQQTLYEERRKALTAELKALAEVARLARDELAMVERLVATGDASQVELLRARKSVTEAESALANRKNKYIQDVSAELAKVREDYEQVEQQATQKRQQLANSVVSSPASGIVKNVKFTTLGGVLRAGDELLQVVPVDDQMIVEAKVLPRDIALIRPGLKATIKFDAYDYTVFGMVDGEVIYVSADSMRDESQRADSPAATYYRVHVRTTAPGPVTRTGRKIEVLPGMTAQVDIRTGQRTLLAYLLKPVTKTLTEAFKER